MTLILLNVVAIILESIPEINRQMEEVFCLLLKSFPLWYLPSNTCSGYTFPNYASGANPAEIGNEIYFFCLWNHRPAGHSSFLPAFYCTH
jgi:hypothetical protein